MRGEKGMCGSEVGATYSQVGFGGIVGGVGAVGRWGGGGRLRIDDYERAMCGGSVVVEVVSVCGCLDAWMRAE